MKGRKQFTFYRSYLDGMYHFPREEWLGFILALIQYALDKNVEEELTETQVGMFKFVKPHLDTAWMKAENASHGLGTPKTKRKRNENKKENEKENEIENEIETETEGEGFARFWERYPQKLGRDEAEAQWVCVSVNYSEKIILDGLDKWLNSVSWNLQKGRFVPKADKWLREEWFLQDPKQDVPMGASGKLGKAEVEAIQRMFGEKM